MERLTSIVAMNHEGVIGCGNTLPWRLQQDMQFFKQETMGNVVLMGRKTFDSLGRRCLPKRYNLVISHDFGLFPDTDTCKAAHGIEDALFRATLAPAVYRETYVIGGASMYLQFAPYVDRYLVTIVNKEVSSPDTFFPRELISDEKQWEFRFLGDARASDVNEASFAIFELQSRNRAAIIEQRSEAIEQVRARSMASVRPLPRRRSSSARLPDNYALSMPL
jgi:dihydrofolate reductase